MTDDLRRRVLLAVAETLVSYPDPERAVMLACDLIVAGLDGPAVVALATESARTLSEPDADRHIEAVAAELGIEKPDLRTAVALVAADVCARLLDGTLPVEAAVHRLLVIGHDGSDLTGRLDEVLTLTSRLMHELDAVADAALTEAALQLARDLQAEINQPERP